MSIESVKPSSHLILCHPLLLLPLTPPSIRVFSNESTLRMRWPKYWSFSFSIIPSEEIPGLRSFRMDWLDLLAVQGTLKSLLQHHSSNCFRFHLILTVTCEVGVIILILQDGKTGVQCYKSGWAQECVGSSWGKAAWRAEKAGYSRPGVVFPTTA